jgi:hypothetical protein
MISNLSLKYRRFSNLFFYILSLKLLCQTKTNYTGSKSDSDFHNDRYLSQYSM